MRKMREDQYKEASKLLKVIKSNNSLLYELMMKVDRRVDADKLTRHNLDLDDISLDLERKMKKDYPNAETVFF